MHNKRYERFLEERKRRILPKGIYVENHHILPKSLGGSDSKENMIILTAREHFIAHMILWKLLGGKMTFAFKRMVESNQNGNILSITSRQYHRLKEDFAIYMSLVHKGQKAHNRGKIAMNNGVSYFFVDPENIQKNLDMNHQLGSLYKHTEETKLKIQKTNTEVCQTIEFRSKMSNITKTRYLSPEAKEVTSKALKKGWENQEERKQATSLRMRQINPSQYVTQEIQEIKSKKMQGRHFYNNGKEQRLVKGEEATKLLSQGWHKGKLPVIKKACPHCGQVLDPGNLVKHIKSKHLISNISNN